VILFLVGLVVGSVAASLVWALLACSRAERHERELQALLEHFDALDPYGTHVPI